MRERLEAIARELGFDAGPAAIDRLLTLRGLWLAQGRAINLTGAANDDELLQHLGDGIATVVCAAKLLASGDQPRELDGDVTWLDVGSGGGFPGLVVAALVPVRLTLVEPRLRRAAFLEFAVASIGHKSTVLRARIGDATWDKYAAEQEICGENARYAVATARAVFVPAEWLALGEKLVTVGGGVIAHLRPGQTQVDGIAPDVAVEWGRSRIGGFVTPIRGRLERRDLG